MLCAFAEGDSVLFGAPQLSHKESNRIESTAELVRQMGRSVTLRDDGMIVHGRDRKLGIPSITIDFDTCEDHRLAFAAAVAREAGAPINILYPEVVSKSFPEFWDLLNSSRSSSETRAQGRHS